MNALEIGKLAEHARMGKAKPLQEFVALAKQEGYRAGFGGMLHLNGEHTGIRGWRALADRVYFGMVRLQRVESGPGD